MSKNVLIAHGYRTSSDEIGSLNRLIIKELLLISDNYQYILLPSGWHDPRVGARPTAAEDMKKYILTIQPDLKSKLYTQFDTGGKGLLPARTTYEDVLIAGEMAWMLGLGSNDTFDALGICFMHGRIVKAHRALGSPCSKVISAKGWSVLLSRQCYVEPLGRIMTWLEPEGVGPLNSRCQNSRTVTLEGYRKPDPKIWKRVNDLK